MGQVLQSEVEEKKEVLEKYFGEELVRYVSRNGVVKLWYTIPMQFGRYVSIIVMYDPRNGVVRVDKMGISYDPSDVKLCRSSKIYLAKLKRSDAERLVGAIFLVKSIADFVNLCNIINKITNKPTARLARAIKRTLRQLLMKILNDSD